MPSTRAPRSLRDRLLLLALAVIVAGGIAWLIRAVAWQEVWLVNGLGVPVQVEIGGRRENLPAGGRTPVWVLAGARRVRTTTPRGTVEEEPIVIPRADVVLYNVAGAAPLYTETIYYSQKGTGGPAPSFTFHGGKRLSVLSGIDHVFEEPPSTISMKEGTSYVVRSVLRTAPGGWKATVAYLDENSRRLEALQLVRQIAAVQPEDEDAAGRFEALLSGVRGWEASLNLARRRVEADAANVGAHRSVQYWERLLGRAGETRARYRAAYEADRSVQNAALLARVEAAETALALLHDALAREPKHGLARRALAMLQAHRGDFPAAAALFEAVALDEDPEYHRYLDDHARCLVAAGRAQEAADSVARYTAKHPKSIDWTLAVAYAQLARLTGVTAPGPPATFIDKVATQRGQPDFRVWMSTLAEDVGDERVRTISDASLKAVTTVQQLAGRDPAAAWAECRKLGPEPRRQLAPIVALLLGAEYDRVGDPELADALFRVVALHVGLAPAELRQQARDRTAQGDDWRLGPEMRAALDFVYGRHLEAAGQDASAWYGSARRGDALQGVVWRAVLKWPHPRPGVARTLVVRAR